MNAACWAAVSGTTISRNSSKYGSPGRNSAYRGFFLKAVFWSFTHSVTWYAPMPAIFSGSLKPMSSISFGISGTRFSMRPLKNALFGLESVTFTVNGSTASAFTMFCTMVARWNPDLGIFRRSAYRPPMRSMFHATSAAVNCRPLNGAMLWRYSFGWIL